ncbi:MAG: hypothetical protein IJR68_03755 [Fretibacterium sp.]|nr:hypothetical protein [Fretibacterium sp.]
MVGYYDLYQLGTVRETERMKGHRGLFPWHPATIRRMVVQGTFPAPMKLGRKNAWKAEVIWEYDKLVGMGVALAEAVVQAQAAAVRNRHDAA